MARSESQRHIRRWLFIGVAVIVAVRIAVWLIPSHRQTGSLVRWVPLAQAKSRAAQSQKKILYEFSAAWCGPCKMMEREVFSDARLAAMINERFVPVRVVDRQAEDGANAPDVEAVQQAYRVRAFPTLVVADAAGSVVDRAEGYGGAAKFEQFIDSFTNAPGTSH